MSKIYIVVNSVSQVFVNRYDRWYTRFFLFRKLVNVFSLICHNAIMTSVRFFLIDMIDDTRASFDFES